MVLRTKITLVSTGKETTLKAIDQDWPYWVAYCDSGFIATVDELKYPFEFVNPAHMSGKIWPTPDAAIDDDRQNNIARFEFIEENN